MRLKLIFPDLGRFPLVYRRYIPTLGPAIIAALTPPDVEISFSDERLKDVDVNGDYDLVAISVMTPQANRAYELASKFKSRGIPVVMGGVHVSLLPDEAAKHADSIVIGEAEDTWPDVIKDFKSGGLKKVYRCPNPPSSVPLPRWDIFDRNVYIPMNAVQVSRGCPINCDMCSVPQTFGRSFRMFDTDKILKDLDKLDRYLFLVNDNLHLAKRRVKPFMEGLARSDKQWVGLAPLSFAGDLEYLSLIQKSNCWAMYIDLSPWVSASLNEIIDEVEVRRAGEYLRRVHDHGIKVIASFVFGFDHDEKDIFEKTVEFAKKNNIEEVEFHILTPYPKSRLYERLSTEGRLISGDFSKYTAGSVVYRPANMTPDELYEGYQNAWRWFYGDKVEETDAGPVVKSFAGFPVSEDRLLSEKGGEWLNSVITERMAKVVRQA